MTLENLTKLFRDVYVERYNFTNGNVVAAEEDGIRAVVTALRETFGLAYSEGRMSIVRGGNENHQRQWVDALINQILASDGVEADYIRKDTRVVIDPGTAYCAKPEAPAAAPVCEWTKNADADFSPGCDPEDWGFGEGHTVCPRCSRTISIKSEAAR